MRQHSSISNSDACVCDNENRQLKRWITYLACVVLIILLLDRGIFGWFAPPVHEFLLVSEHKIDLLRKRLSEERRYDAVVVGSSMAHSGFNPALFQTLTGLSTLNAGVPTHTPVDRILKTVNLIFATKTPKLVIYTIESWAFNYLPTPGPLDARAKNQITDLFEAHRHTKELSNWTRALLRGKLDPLPFMAPETLISPRFSTYENTHQHDDGWVEVNAVGRPDFVSPIGDWSPRVEQIAMLRKLPELVESKGAKLVIVQMPEHETALTAFPTRHQKFSELMQELMPSLKVPYFDFSGDASFPFREIEYFYDTNHLNSKGANLFTRQLAERLAGTVPQAVTALTRELNLPE
jgi:hypothetical protein